VDSKIKITNENLLLAFLIISTVIFSCIILDNMMTNIVYGQIGSDLLVSNRNTANLINLEDIPLEKVQVGDIEIAYRLFGKGEPLILHNGASDSMDAWDPTFLTSLAANNSVIVFDSRGMGNSSSGNKPYSIQLLANDTSGMMDGLDIPKANVLGYDVGSFIVQQLAVAHPNKASSIILISGSCGGEDAIPRPTEFDKLRIDILNKFVNNILVSPNQLELLVNASLGAAWLKLHPESVDIPNSVIPHLTKISLNPETIINQMKVGLTWMAPTWDGACNDLANLDKPMLVVTGTEDNMYIPHENSVVITNEIPWASLVQIKDAGHIVVDQYPEEVGKAVQKFLSRLK
jgi:pimeloyl-ACP methyl ester carboxylesterase